MKKIYLSPELETLELRLSSKICDISNNNVSGDPVPAPKPRPDKPF